MNKNELIDICAAKTHDYKADARKYVEAIFESITEALVKGDSVKIKGFGCFKVKTHGDRIGRNPHKPEMVYHVSAKKAVAFRAGKALRDAVNK